jgi:putative flippase GtrA
MTKLVKLKKSLFELIKEMFNYGLIGISNTVILLGLLYVLTKFLRIHYLISSIISFLITNIYSYYTTKHYTFKKKEANSSHGKKFLVISLIMLGINSTFLYLFTDFFHINYIFSQIISGFIIYLVSFFLHKYWTFRD